MITSISPLTEIELDATDEVIKMAYNVSQSRKESLRRYLTLQPEGAFVAKQQNRVVGFCNIMNYGSFAYIGLMSVHPALQKQGIGHILMEHALAWIEAAAPLSCSMPHRLACRSISIMVLWRMTKPLLKSDTILSNVKLSTQSKENSLGL